MAQSLDQAIRNAEGQSTPRVYSELMDVAAQLMSSNAKRFGSTDAVMKMIGQLSDLSHDTESFKMGTRAITRMYAGGQVDYKHLQEFSANTGYNLAAALMKAGGLKNKDELEKALGESGQWGQFFSDLRKYELVEAAKPSPEHVEQTEQIRAAQDNLIR